MKNKFLSFLLCLFVYLLGGVALAEETPVSDFDYYVGEDGVCITGYHGSSTTIVIPDFIEDQPVISVDLHETEAMLVNVSLPKTVITLPEYAFMNIQTLQNVYGLENVQYLNRYVFTGTGVTEARFSQKLKWIDYEAFDVSNLLKVTIPNDVQFVSGSFTNLIIQEFHLIDGNGVSTLSLVDGVLYSPDHKTIIGYPYGRSDYRYVILDGTETIQTGVLTYVNHRSLKEMVIPATITEIDRLDLNWGGEGATFYVEPGGYASHKLRELESMGYIPILKSLADLNTDDLVDLALRECIHSGMSDYEKALAIHDWIIENCSYDYTMTRNTGYQMLKYHSAVCAGYAEAYEMLAKRAGLNCTRSGNYEHEFNAVNLDGHWVYIDCTWDDVGFDELMKHRYFGFEYSIRTETYGGNYHSHVNGNIVHTEILSDDHSARYHYFYKAGVLNDALEKGKQEIIRQLDSGATGGTFIVDFNGPSDIKISNMLIAALLQEEAYLISDQTVEVFCAFHENEGDYVWKRKIEIDPSELFDFKQVIDGISIVGYKGTEQEVTIPDAIFDIPVVEIAADAFLYNTKIRSVHLPKHLKRIMDYAFSDCYSLTTVNFPDTLERIDTCAFYACYSLKSDIILPEGLIYLGGLAFEKCHSITYASLPGSITDLHDAVFLETPSLSRVDLHEGIRVIPAAFLAESGIEYIKLPESVELIGNNAFGGTALKEIYIPASVTSMGKEVFYNCFELTNIQIDPQSVSFVMDGDLLLSADRTFVYFCDYSATDVTIPDGVQALGGKIFWEHQNLKHVFIPGSVSIIPEQCFGNCPNLTTVELSEGIQEIQDGAFCACYSLKPLAIPSTVTTLGSSVFNGTFDHECCYVVIPETVVNFGTVWLPNYPAITVVGAKGSYVENYAKQWHIPFISLDEYTSGQPVRHIANDMAEYKPASKDQNGWIDALHCRVCNYPIRDMTVIDCQRILTLPVELTTVDAEAFSNINAQQIILGDHVTSIGKRAFANNSCLLLAIIPESVTSIAEDAFAGDENVILCVRYDSDACIYARIHNLPYVTY